MLLIRNGLIHTMTDAGTFRGDILIEDGKIHRVSGKIDENELTRHQVMEAEGLQVCPGLIDAHMHLIQSSDDAQRSLDALCDDALASGVTTQALWPETSGLCILRHGRDDAKTKQPMHSIQPDGMTDAQLLAKMAEITQQGQRVACEVDGQKTLIRLLQMQRQTAAKLVFVHLNGCEDYVEEIAASGAEVILGSSTLRSGLGGYAMALKLHLAGVNIALTADYPATRMHHLPLCASLCVRAGMAHHAALRTITLDAARLLGVDDVCGSIEEGKRADLTIFDGDPMLLVTGRVMSMSGGRILKES